VGVYGQQDFLSTATGTTDSTFPNPAGVAIAKVGTLSVSDYNNNRVLVFLPATINQRYCN